MGQRPGQPQATVACPEAPLFSGMTKGIRTLTRPWMPAALLAAGILSAADAAPGQENPCPPAPSLFRGGSPPAPAKVRHFEPRFPTRSLPTTIGEGLWIGELAIDVDGRVRSVRVLRRVSITPPWPEWERAIPDAVRRWRYAVPCVMGKPRRVLMAVAFDPVRRAFWPREGRPSEK